ncbi:hypothetical protein M948_18080 [Virgibacillus sp. CM-4]|uniref:hypothetical protein n=1 Tax=Virgibacillus sp. CM-4 TaxID=1354277 RepID=UPI0003883DC6|nr:hypothetical protein [Virgibacillus sp. CM-4]EQB35014.1 hypothetical protein M948_18080 [Virgibacillus sp. CM-4]
MSQKELQLYRERFIEIMWASKEVRDHRITALMDDMKKVYNIPDLYSAAFEFNNPEVMQLYREISYAKDLIRR